MPDMPNLGDFKNPLIKPLQTVANLTQINQHRLEQSVAASLAGGLIAASGRPHSIQEALDLVRDIQFALYPAPGHGIYQKWAETKPETLAKVRA